MNLTGRESGEGRSGGGDVDVAVQAAFREERGAVLAPRAGGRNAWLC